MLDGMIGEGLRTMKTVAALNDSELAAYIGPGAYNFSGTGKNRFVIEFEWRQDAAKAAASVGSQYQYGRRMEGEDEPVGVDEHTAIAVAAAMFRGGAKPAEAQSEGLGTRVAARRRRLSQHDEWGGVLLTLRLARFANVYTCVPASRTQERRERVQNAMCRCIVLDLPCGSQGPKQTILDLIAVIGGASGSLIGLLGFGIFAAELIALLVTKFSGPKSSTSTVKKGIEGFESAPL